MTINRYTAVCYSFHYHEIWSKSVVCVLLVADLIIAHSIPVQLYIVKFSYERCEHGWILKGRSRPIHETRIISSVLTVCYEVISLVLICRTIYSIRSQFTVNGRRITQEMCLVFVTTINCLLSVLECVYDISYLIDVDSDSFVVWMAEQYDVYAFILLTSNAFSIVFLSYAVRCEILRRWVRPTSTPNISSVYDL
ncbi:hypothetical protein RB195_008526 [Necator americanus]